MKKLLIITLATMALTACSSEEEGKKQGDGGVVELRINNDRITFPEGARGEVRMRSITFNLSRRTDNETSISYELVDGTALAGQHYVSESDVYSVTIPPRSQAFSLNVGIIGNNEYNDDRHFTLRFAEADGIQLPSNREVQITIENDDPYPKVSFNTELLSAHPDVGVVSVLLQQDRVSALNTRVKLELDGLATRGVRYLLDLDDDTATIPAGASDARFDVQVISDGIPRGNENIQITLSNPENSEIGSNNELNIIIRGALGMPDTGVKSYYNLGDFNATAPDVEHPYQDADFGRDVDYPADAFDGYASLSYTKLDLSGNPLPDTAEHFHCVRDNTTGLIWERKFASADGQRITPGYYSTDFVNRVFFRYVDDQFMWRDTSNLNGGNAGGSARGDLERMGRDGWESTVSISNGGHCALPRRGHSYEVSHTHGCTTEAYIQALNNSGACGFSDWRVPHISELSTLGVYDAPASRLDSKFLLDPVPTQQRGPEEHLRFWSSTPSAENESSAWCFDLETGMRMFCQKNAYFRLIGVRGGAQ